MINPTFQSFDGHRLDDSEIGLFWEEASYNADRIFDGPFFVAVEGLAKLDLSAQEAVGWPLPAISGPVVLVNGAAQSLRQSGECPIQGIAHGTCGFGAKLGEFGVAGFPFD